MDLDDAKADALVAGVAAGCTVVLALLLEYGLGVHASVPVRVSPLFVYPAYLLAGRFAVGPRDVRTWALATLLVTLGALGYALV